jgi:esterase
MQNAIALHQQSLGSGPPLLILHGLFGCGTNWRSIARGLQDCRRVFLLDLRNHGDSPHHEGMDYPTLAADVRAFMDDAGIDEADVIGHSMGGKTAMRLAMDSPKRVSRLMVVDIAPAPSGSDHLPLIDAMMAIPVERLTRRAQADAALAATVAEASLRAFLLQNLKNGPHGLRWRIDLERIRAAMPALVAFPLGEDECYRGDTMFVRGALSDYVREEHAGAITRHFPTARVESVPDAGHWVHAEQPALFLDIARRFLGCGQ